MKKAEKVKLVEFLHKELSESKHLFVTGFGGLSVQEEFQLRKAVREAGGRYRVVKNRLVARAAQGTPAEQVLQGLKGMTSIAYTNGDPVALAKVLRDYAKEHESFQFRAALVDGKVLDVSQIEALASLPSREELFAKLLYLIQAPAQRVAMVLNAVGRNLAVVLDQACKEKRFPEGESS